MKKIVSLIIIFVFTFVCSPCVLAYQFPHAIWKHDNAYRAAQKSGNLQGIIDAGEKALEVIANEPKNDTIMSYRASRTYELAKTYEKLKKYKESAYWYGQAIEPNIYMGFDDAVKICRIKMRAYTPELSIYKQTYSTQSYFGAKNEHETGVLWGVTCDSETRNEFPNESMTMVYHQYGQEFNKYMETFMQGAVDKNIAIEFALNLKNEAADVLYVKQQEAWLDGFIDMLNKYNTVPVYLRFAGEVNVWGNQPNPEDYKEAFRFVADKIHNRAPHVAVVFGLNFVSDWSGDFTKYYPGDEYVDWIGVSLYMNKYFQGHKANSDQDKINEIVFHANNAAEPVQIMRDIVDIFGDRKPILIFESGASHYIKTENEHATKWAEHHLDELINYVPMVFPQVKLIGYFNTVMQNEEIDYALTTDGELRWYYSNLIKSPMYIQNNCINDDAVTYSNCNSGFTTDKSVGTFGIYAYDYESEYKSVSYFVDGVQVGWSDTIPYLCDIDFKNYSNGQHTLTVKAYCDTNDVIEKTVPFTVGENISVVINGNTLQNLDQPPVIVNGRTLVPVRAILENIGASVSWDEATKTVTAEKGDVTLKLNIGSKTIYKNGIPYEIDVSPKIIHGRTCLPVRAVSEHFGLNISWDNNTRTVIITE